MTVKEFAKGWTLLIAQPWGRRYDGDSEVAATQREFYFHAVKDLPGQAWWNACATLASKQEWPSLSAVKALVSPSGHPGPEQAWAMMRQKVQSDAPTVFVTEPMREAYGAAMALAGDLIAARMAFKETYTQAVERAEAAGQSPRWSMITGTDRTMREAAILDAVKQGYVSGDWASRQLPVEAHASLLALVGAVETKRLT